MALDHAFELVEKADAGVLCTEVMDVFDVRILGS
jgi:hypothetical protein